jgi:hypothetical protein
MSKLRRNAFALKLQALVLGLLLQLAGCGGGGNGGSPAPPPTPDFQLVVSPTSQSVNAGNSASVSLSATAINGFSSQISVQVTGIPTGVSISPTSITLMVGTPQQVTFTAAANAPNAGATVTFTGTSVSLTHTAGLSFTVNGSSNGGPGRTRYVRTDATTEYFGWINQHWMVYHAATSRYFVTDPSSNEVIVLDAASQTELGTIGVPGAFGIDDTPDHKTLYVGTQIGDVYAIDPVAMTVMKRYIASEIGPYGYLALSTLALSDGRLALLGAQGGFPSIDGSTSIAVWNPADNSITIYGGFEGGALPLPCGGFMGNIGGFARTVDRTKIILGSIDSDGTLCELDASTGQSNYVSAAAFGLYDIVTSPDGKYIVLPGASGAILYDASTLAVAGTVNINVNVFGVPTFLLTVDSKTLFFTTQNTIYAYDIATQQLLGWVPNLFLPPTSGGFAVGPIDGPYLLTTDGTGLFAGPMEEGIGFVDLSALQTGPVGTLFANGYLNPAAGPNSGGTATKWADPSSLGTLKNIYFGTQRATAISASSGYINATTPSGKAGPADVYTFTTDGGMQLLPEAFSYGPTILEVTPNTATAGGGGTGYIYGYGFGPVTSNKIPSDLKVTVAGVAAPVTAFIPYAYPTSAPPFPLQSVAYTIPSGSNGSAVDVAVSTSAGSATAQSAFTYLPSIQQFPLAGSTLAQGIYDSYTDLYYFTDASRIQVFSRSQGKWLSPISIPAPPGPAQRLWGIALSPDGSKLAVSDANAGAIYLLDPANPTSVKTFIVGSQSGFIINPCAVAISDAGNVYYTVFALGGTGADQFFKLNTNTGAITNYGIDSPGLAQSDMYLRNAISSDNARVFFNDDGYVFSVDTATDKLFSAADGFGCCYGNYELALSNNQTQFTATFYIYDSDLNGQSYYALNDREILNILYVYGAKLSPDGRLLFQPSTNGIDVFDGRLGNLRTRISLPVPLSLNYDALVADGVDNILICITGTTGNGIAVVDLTGLGEPPLLSYDNEFGARTHRLSELGNFWQTYSRHPHSGRQDARPASPVRAVRHATATVLRHSN